VIFKVLKLSSLADERNATNFRRLERPLQLIKFNASATKYTEEQETQLMQRRRASAVMTRDAVQTSFKSLIFIPISE